MDEIIDDDEWGLAEQLNSQLVAEYGQDEAIRLVSQLAGYREPPPTIDQFIDDDEYMGRMLGGNIYPEWRQQLRAVYPSPFYSPYFQVICAGAIGIGKSTMSMGIQSYDLCKLSHVVNPQRQYQLLHSQEIVIGCFNATVKLAQSVLVDPLMEWIESSPYFQREISKSDGKYLLPNKLGIVPASRSSHVLGKAVVGGLISEIEFMDKIKSQATEVYRQVQRRMQSRFARGDGMLEPGHLVVDSSARYAEGFQAQLMLEARNDKEKRSLIVEKAIWEVLGPAGKITLSGKTFKLFVGDQHRDPLILTSGQGYNIPPALVIDVPEEYRKFFEQDIYGAVRDFAGRSTASIHKFFTQIQLLLDSMKQDPKENAPNPCEREVIELDFDDADDRLINYIDVSKLRKDMPYYIHVDIGIKRDKTGIALTRPSGEMIVNRVGRALESSIVQDMVFRTDLVLCVAPRPGKELPIAKLRNFIIDLRHNHIRVAGVSCDGFQSAQFLQEMNSYGISAELVSVDRTRDPYDQFKNVITERRWSGPYHPVLEREFLNLIDFGKKIDHPDPDDALIDKRNPPSKDVADAVVGSVYLCKERNQLDTGTNALKAYVKEIEKAEKKLTIQDHIFDLGMKNKNKNRGFFSR